MKRDFEDIDRYIDLKTDQVIREKHEALAYIDEHEHWIVSRITRRYLKWLGIIGVTSIAGLLAAVLALYGRVESVAVSTAETIAQSEVEELKTQFDRAGSTIDQLHQKTIDTLAGQLDELSDVRATLAQVRLLLPALDDVDIASANQLAELLDEHSESLDALVRSEPRIDELEAKTGSVQMTLANLVPIGTVVMSDLAPLEFDDLVNGDSRFDAKVAQWLPADGRTASGTRYGEKRANVPDMRGLFVRGHNEFEDGQLAERDPGPRDRDGIQSSQLGAHSHFLFADIQLNTNSEPADRIDADSSVAIANRTGAVNISDYHLVSGGQSAAATLGASSVTGVHETRPINYAMYFYVKVN